MAKLYKVLEGYSKVVEIEEAGYSSYFALYDDGIDYRPGDTVVLSNGYEPARIKQILPVEEITQKIVHEVIGKIDISAYEQRLEQRKRKEELRKELGKRKREIQREIDDDYCASKDEKYAELLNEYREILK